MRDGQSLVDVSSAVIDALLQTAQLLDQDPTRTSDLSKKLPALDDNKKLILVTGHRLR